jgi:hypothetical protein
LQGWYAAAFEREMGCTEAEWLMWLPGAVAARPLQLGAGVAQVAIGAGTLRLSWQSLPERRIALMRLPRLAVRFAFDAVDDAVRQGFMRYFDLYTRRGGG